MTEVEYLSRVQNLRKRVNGENATEILKELEELLSIKPVRGICLVAKAEAMLEKKVPLSEIYTLLDRKIRLSVHYEFAKDVLNLYKKLDEKRNNFIDKERIQLKAHLFDTYENNSDIRADEWITRRLQKTLHHCERFLDDANAKDNVQELIADFFIEGKHVMCMLMCCIFQKIFNEQSNLERAILEIPNMGFAKSVFLTDEMSTFAILCVNESEYVISQVATRALHVLGKRVILLKQPRVIDVEESDDIMELINFSVADENVMHEEQLDIYQPLTLRRDNTVLGDNRENIVAYLKETYCREQNITVLCQGYLMDELCTSQILRSNISRLFRVRGSDVDDDFTFAWLGDYRNYIADLYKMNVTNAMKSPSSCRFSIVIPARNSSDTLSYTIRTCLEQTFEQDYEIIISDNSTGYRTDIYEMCQSLHDQRIVYIKTPRDLPLPKSFEYAYLHAKGEYIFAMGSDDGLLPWALESIDTIIQQYPDEEIIQWERGFYAWPGFNGGQENQFVIPRAYEKGNYNLFYRDNIDYVASVLLDSRKMYTLPMLYINSCFKRSYFDTLLKKTGRLWDGICQDIYMGVITACIQPRILNMQYPLSIAGMSGKSIGAKANIPQTTNTEFMKSVKEAKGDNNMGGFCSTYYERLLPDTGTDTSSLYGALLRAVSIGVLPDTYLSKVFDWKKMFLNLSNELDVRDVAFDREIHEMRYAAMHHGEEFLQWFDETIYHPLLTPRYIDEEKLAKLEKQRMYQCGVNSEAGVTLDASEYKVKNIYEAVKLFEKVLEW